MKQTFLLSSAITALLLPSLVFAADEPILIKSPTSPAVYLVQDGSRHPFPLQKIYESWYGTTFKNVLSVSAEALAAYPLGKNVKFKQGSLIKIQTDPKVYLVTDSAGHLEWIKTEAEFKARGLSFKDVRDVPDAFFPDYLLAQPENNFATPEQGTPASSTPPSQTDSSTPPSIVITPLALQSVSSTAIRVDNRSKISYTITSSAPAPLSLTYQVFGSAPVTKEFETATTTFTGIIDAGLAETIPYKIILGSGTDKLTKSGTFAGYVDFSVNASADFSPEQKPLVRPTVRLGAFSITNNSTSQRLVSAVTILFTSTNLASDAITKTLEIKRLKSDGTVDKSFGEIIFAGNTSIIGPAKAQKIITDEIIAPGETRTYEIIGRLFDTMDRDAYLATDTLSVSLDRLDSNGDFFAIYPNKPIGTLIYKK